MSRQAVADALGVTRGDVTLMESGERAVETQELMGLAQVHGCNCMALLGQCERLSLDGLYEVLLRELPEMKADGEAGLEIRRAISRCQEGAHMRNFLGRPVEPELPDYSARLTKVSDAIRQGEEAAHAERRRLGLGTAPIRNIDGLLCDQGIWALATRLPDGLSGVFVRHPSIGMMTLANRDHGPAHRRFSHAHEYARALFDRRSVVSAARQTDSPGLTGRRAGAFVAAFLMPREDVERRLDMIGKGLPAKAAARPRPGSEAVSFADVAIMARHFGVDYDAIVWRLRNLAHIGSKGFEILINAKGLGELYAKTMGMDEQGDRGLDTESASREAHIRIASLTIEAYRQLEVSQGKVMGIGRDLQVDSMNLLEVAAASRVTCAS